MIIKYLYVVLINKPDKFYCIRMKRPIETKNQTESNLTRDVNIVKVNLKLIKRRGVVSNIKRRGLLSVVNCRGLLVLIRQLRQPALDSHRAALVIRRGLSALILHGGQPDLIRKLTFSRDVHI